MMKAMLLKQHYILPKLTHNKMLLNKEFQHSSVSRSTHPALKIERHHQRWSSPDSWKYVSATATHAVTLSRIM